MALAGVHVTCAFAGARGFSNSSVEVIGRPVWAQTLATAETTTSAAPMPTEQGGTPMFQVSAAVDAFISIGPAPDANGVTKTRFFIRAGETREYAVGSGDKLSWVAA